jgi:hypothetical protein
MLLLALTACGQVQEAATGAASNAASQAASKATADAKAAAAGQVRDQICQLTRGAGPLADSTPSKEIKAAVGQLATSAETAGAPAETVARLRKVATGSVAETKKAVAGLKKSCKA